MLAKYSSSIKPEHEQAKHVLRLQNLSTSTEHEYWVSAEQACARTHP